MIKIGEFANIFDVSIKTLRLYDEKGLLSPDYIDIYTGYRYYDDESIKTMTKILILKDLGLSLQEIKNFKFEENDINEKVKEYEQKLKDISKNIHTLKSFTQTKGGIKNMKAFINDDIVIGKWKLLGISNTIKEAKDKKFIEDDDFKINELYLMPKGQEYWVIKWTKGFIYIKNNPCPYEIDNDIMYLSVIDPVNGKIGKYAVYEKQDSKEYTREEIQIKDDMNIEFIKDEKLIGTWKSVDFVETQKKFNPKEKSYKESLYLEKIIVSNDNDCIAIYNFNNANNTFNLKFTKNYIAELGALNTLSKYEYLKIDNKDYISVEWKSGDYVYGKMINGYYILEKIN